MKIVNSVSFLYSTQASYMCVLHTTCYVAFSTSQLAEAMIAIIPEDINADSDSLGSKSPFLHLKYWRIDILYIVKRETVMDQDSNLAKTVS